MLLELLSKLSRPKSDQTLTQTSSKPLDLSASSEAPSPESSNSTSWKTQAINQIKRHEGIVLHAYQDHLGWWTIGIGRLIDKRKGGGITQEEAEYLLGNDIDRKLAELQSNIPWLDQLNDARKAVLLNMAFQMGTGGLMGFTTTLHLLKTGQFDAAADSMLQSLWAKQTPGRAKEMSEQIRTGQWQSG